MAFNGIQGAVNVPGQIPWPLVVAYFGVALAIVFYFGKKYGILKRFTTLDLIIIGIGAAAAVVWEFYIGSFLGRLVPRSPFIGIHFWGRLIITFITVAMVRKPGAGMTTLAVFNLLSDIFHYGFGGEPIYFVYESLTYGLFLDLMIVLTKGRLFGVGVPEPKANNGGSGVLSATSPKLRAAVEGGVLGLLWAIPSPVFYLGFFKPFIFGSAPNWAQIQFNLLAYIPGDVVFGVIGGLMGLYVAKAVGR